MKILLITYNQVGHGTYLRTYEFARELVKLGQEVSIMAASNKTRDLNVGHTNEYGFDIYSFPGLFSGGPRSGWDPYSLLTRLIWANKRDFDLIHGFETRPTVIYPALIYKKRGVPLILDWCDWFGAGGSVEERPNKMLRFFFRPVETFYENHFRKIADHTTVICKKLYSRALDFGVKPEKLTLLPNGLNMPGWKLKNKIKARKFFKMDADEFVIGYVGSLFPKDAILMQNAFKIILETMPNARLLHLGRSKYLSEPLNENIMITGNIDIEILQLGLAACDICWLPLSDRPANWGRFPLKFSNYISAGKAVLSTNVGDIPNYIAQFKIGEVCEPNPEALAESIINLKLNPLTLKYYSENALRLSKNKKYSWEALSRILWGKYNELSK